MLVEETSGLMRGRLLLNVLLLVCAATLGGWIYQRGSSDAAHQRLAAIDPLTVRRIEVTRADAEQLVLVRRSADDWQLLKPQVLPASGYHLDLLLAFLQAPVAARYPSTEVDLAAAGLAQPRLVLRVDSQDFAFGSLDPLQQRRYLRHGDEVLLVREGVSAILASPWWNFIDRRLLPAGEPRALHFADGHVRVLDPPLQRLWQQASASIVRPLAAGVAGEALALELRSGERIDWQWLGGGQPRLLRPELGLEYQLPPGLLEALLGREPEKKAL